MGKIIPLFRKAVPYIVVTCVALSSAGLINPLIGKVVVSILGAA